MALTAEVARLLADARQDLPGAIPDGLKAAYFAMLRDFLDFTNVWQEDIPVTLVVGTTSYSLTPPVMGRINRLIILWDSQATHPRSTWIDNAALILPTGLLINTRPSAVATWVATVAKTVKDPSDADGVPIIDAWIIEKYWDTLLSGIYCRMMASPNKTYSSPQLAIFHGKKFLSGKTVARNEAIKANVRGQTNWQYPQIMGRWSQRGY